MIAAADGAEAWEQIRSSNEPTLVILDWMMPKMDGPDVCRMIRNADILGRVYVLLLTSREAHADLIAGLNAGADDYLTKPFDPEELRARVQVGVRVLTLQQKLADRVAELQDALSRVKQLQGLVPICSYCKRTATIRITGSRSRTTSPRTAARSSATASARPATTR